MDAELGIAIERLRRALELYRLSAAAAAAAAETNSATNDEAGPTTRSRTRRIGAHVLNERQAEQAELSRTMRRLVEEAAVALRSARAVLVSATQGRSGRTLRCQKCGLLSSDLRITRGCQHRLCRCCLQDTCEALFVRRVQQSSGILPPDLQRPPPIITSAYVQDVRRHGVNLVLHCPFCSASIHRVPLRIPLYSDVLGVVDQLVHIPSTSNGNQRADVSSYF